MTNNFLRDLVIAKTAEEDVISALSYLAPDIEFVDVSNDRAYFYKGDIKAVLPDGRSIMLEVKRDTRICDTGNVLCEEQVYYFDTNSYAKGNFYSDYEIYIVVCPQKHKMVIMDFAILKSIYKGGRFREIPHEEQITYCYLLPLDEIEEAGGIIAIIDYDNKEITYRRH